ncbi:MAG: FecR domain-containing protein [Deltaproteobacteria bacterium]|nr:FecR domain-containing protein [Deltaproteobacteria bacterium]
MKRDCEIIHELVFEAQRSGVTPEDRASIKAHLSVCASCQGEVGWIKEVAGSVDFRAAELDSAAEARIHAALRPVFEEAAKAQGQRARRGVWGLSLALSVAAAALLALGLWWKTDAREVPTEVPMAATLERTLSAKVMLRSGVAMLADKEVHEEVAVGQTVQTGKGSLVRLRMAEDRVRLLPESSLKLECSTLRRAVLALRRGTVHVHVKKGQGRHFTVRAPFGLVEVTGTRFAVSTAKGGSVTTLAGSVHVTLPQGESVDVRAGQAWRVGTSKVQPALSSQLTSLRLSFAPAPVSLLSASILFVRGEPAGASVRLDGRAVARAPLWLRHGPGPVRYEITMGGQKKEGVVTLRAGTSVDLRYDFPPSSRPQRRRLSRAGVSAGRARLTGLVRAGDCAGALGRVHGMKSASRHARAEALAMVAECHQAQGENDKALTLYRRIARRFARTPTAANALFEMGRLEAKAGRVTQARAAFRRYLARYGSLPLAADAKFRLCRFDVDGKRYGAAVRCLRSYRKRFVRGTQFSETLYLEARLRKDALNDCRGALTLYQRYRARPGARKRMEEVLFGRVDCLRRLPDPRFPVAAREYLRRYPRGAHAATVTHWHRGAKSVVRDGVGADRIPEK